MASDTEALNYHVMNLKGYIDLVAGPGVRAQDKVGHFIKALSIAKRPDEKKQAISKLASIRTDQALAVVSPFVGDPALGQEASLAVINIVLGGRRDKPLSGSGVISHCKASCPMPQGLPRWMVNMSQGMRWGGLIQMAYA